MQTDAGGAVFNEVRRGAEMALRRRGAFLNLNQVLLPLYHGVCGLFFDGAGGPRGVRLVEAAQLLAPLLRDALRTLRGGRPPRARDADLVHLATIFLQNSFGRIFGGDTLAMQLCKRALTDRVTGLIKTSRSAVLQSAVRLDVGRELGRLLRDALRGEDDAEKSRLRKRWGVHLSGAETDEEP